MLLGVLAALAAPVAAPLGVAACRLAEPFLAALVALAHWAAGLPGAATTLTGPARAAPALATAALLALAARRARAVDALAEPRGRPPPP